MAGKRVLRKYDGKKHGWFKFALTVAAVVIATLIVFNVFIGVSRVSGQSMEPALSDRQIVFYSRISDTYERGDIVSIKMPSGEKYVKRVIAVEGDSVNIRDGKVFVNGRISEEDHVNGVTEKGNYDIVYPYTVKKNTVFVLGDNRENSVDSRTFGPVVTTSISGKLIFQ